MAGKIYVGVTDGDWYDYLRHQDAREVNFWKPSGRPFKVLEEGDLFLFKLKAARHSESLARHRLGQGAFRVMVADAYERRCAVSGERTLLVLQAAHIRPYAQDGPHAVQNGLLLRADIHALFDEGYVTVTPDYRVEVSRRLNADYGNGRIYYAFQGRRLAVLPKERPKLPGRDFLEWHNDCVFMR